jgi:predicted O-methyltransferase YrrM
MNMQKKKRFWYTGYFFKPHQWLRALRQPRLAVQTILNIIRYPRLFRVSQNVEGLTGFNLGISLYHTVLDSQAKSPNVLDLGAFKGLSACYLSLAACRVNKRVKSFELFSGLPTSDPKLDPFFHTGQFSSDQSEYEANIQGYGCPEIIELIVGDARETMLPALGDDGFSVAFLDMDVYEVVREILFQLWGVAKGGEVIIVHDIDSQGVRRAVAELHIASGGTIKECRQQKATTKLCIPPR